MKDYYNNLNQDYSNNKQEKEKLKNNIKTSQIKYKVLDEYQKEKDKKNKVGAMSNNINKSKKMEKEENIMAKIN